MNTCAPTGIPEQIESIETAIEMPGLTVHERDCLRATLVLLKDGQSISTDALNYCDECGFPLSQCGPQDRDGEPSLDCKVCALRADIEHITSLGKRVYADRENLRTELEQAKRLIAEYREQTGCPICRANDIP